MICPFGLRTTYAHEPKVIRVLDDIERAVNKEPNESLDLSGLNLSPLSNKQTPDRTLIHLERLIIKMGNSQYPLESANLTRTNLTGIDLTRAILPEANLTEAILTGTNLWRANLYEADLRGAVVVSNGQTITGEELKQYLLETFKVTLSEGAKF